MNVYSASFRSDVYGQFTKKQFLLVERNKESEPWLSAKKSLIDLANEALAKKPKSKETLIAYGYYFTENIEEEAISLQNLVWLYEDTNNAYSLALAYQLTKEPQYADKALDFINSWATINKAYLGADFNRDEDPDHTCNYKCANWYDQTGADLYMTTNGVALIQAAILLKDYSGFSTTMKNTFSSWVNNVYRKNTDYYLYDNPEFDDNSGSWANYGVVMSHVWFEDKEALQADVEFMKNKIITQISSDGILETEQSRGVKAMWYTYYSLAPMTAAAMVLYNETGVDLFRYKNHDGASIESALDLYFIQSKNPTLYPWVDGKVGKSIWGKNIFAGLTYFLNKPEWRDWLGNVNIMYFTSHMAWSVPTLMRNKHENNLAPLYMNIILD